MLGDIDRDLHGYNPVCMEYFPLTDPSTRTTVGVKVYALILVVIQCVAYLLLDD